MKAKCFTSIGKSTNVDCEVTDSGKYQEQGSDILDAVELYFPVSNGEILSGAIS